MKFVRLLIVFAVLAIMGIALLIGSIKYKAELAKPRGDLETMTEDDFYNGRFVEGTIYELWDNFADMEEYDSTFGIKHNTRVTAQYYALPIPALDEYKFVALALSDSSQQSIAERMVKEIDAFFEDGTVPETTIQIKGKVTKLSGDGLEYLQEYAVGMGLEPSDVVAFTINDGNDGSGSGGMLVIAIVLTVIGLGGAAFVIIRKVISGK